MPKELNVVDAFLINCADYGDCPVDAVEFEVSAKKCKDVTQEHVRDSLFDAAKSYLSRDAHFFSPELEVYVFVLRNGSIKAVKLDNLQQLEDVATPYIGYRTYSMATGEDAALFALEVGERFGGQLVTFVKDRNLEHLIDAAIEGTPEYDQLITSDGLVRAEGDEEGSDED